MPLPISKVISGGQTGVDQVGLRLAQEAGYLTGGTAPKGWRTDQGACLALRDEFGLQESWSSQYAPRTVQNVRDADLTVWFGKRSAGFLVTDRACTTHRKDLLVNPVAHELRRAVLDIARVLERHIVLNVAGNRWRINPQASSEARVVLEEALR